MTTNTQLHTHPFLARCRLIPRIFFSSMRDLFTDYVPQIFPEMAGGPKMREVRGKHHELQGYIITLGPILLFAHAPKSTQPPCPLKVLWKREKTRAIRVLLRCAPFRPFSLPCQPAHAACVFSAESTFFIMGMQIKINGSSLKKMKAMQDFF